MGAVTSVEGIVGVRAKKGDRSRLFSALMAWPNTEPRQVQTRENDENDPHRLVPGNLVAEQTRQQLVAGVVEMA